MKDHQHDNTGRQNPASGTNAPSEPAIGSTYDLMQELDLLDVTGSRLYLDDYDELYLQQPDAEPVGPLVARRAFPLSYEDEFIALAFAQGDDKDTEVGIVRRVKDLDEQSQRILQAELEWRHFTTRITGIHSVETRNYVPHWDVETTRGRHVFEMRSRRDLRVLSGTRVLVRDADGNRYEIPDVDQLDEASRQLIDAQI